VGYLLPPPHSRAHRRLMGPSFFFPSFRSIAEVREGAKPVVWVCFFFSALSLAPISTFPPPFFSPYAVSQEAGNRYRMGGPSGNCTLSVTEDAPTPFLFLPSPSAGGKNAHLRLCAGSTLFCSFGWHTALAAISEVSSLFFSHSGRNEKKQLEVLFSPPPSPFLFSRAFSRSMGLEGRPLFFFPPGGKGDSQKIPTPPGPLFPLRDHGIGAAPFSFFPLDHKRPGHFHTLLLEPPRYFSSFFLNSRFPLSDYFDAPLFFFSATRHRTQSARFSLFPFPKISGRLF